MNLLRVTLLTLVATFVLACSAQSAKQKSGPPLEVSGKSRIAIPEAAFGKEYLLSTSLIPQSGAPTSSGMNGRVVLFELFEDGVDLYETTTGQVVTDELPARRLLTTFPIVEKDGGDVVIDFNAGMKSLALGGWYSIGVEGFDPRIFDRSAELSQSRVFEVLKKGSILSIRQSVRARSRESDADLESRFEVKYFLSPYTPGDFVPREMHPDESKYARFFTGAKTLELDSGRVTQSLSRFEIEDPIVFYYSENTPEELEEAVVDGILYWNKAFGKTLVEAKKAPEGVSAPDPSMNIIQWVPWDRAGFAYADALVDPLTGQTMHGQAYLTSAFDFLGKVRARRMLRSLRAIVDEAEEKPKEETDGEDHLFFAHTLCSLDPVAIAAEMSEGLEKLLADPELSEEAIIKIAQDYVREVTAHEVGHILGLRHNFAGSLSADMTPQELDQFMKDYLAGEDLSEYEKKTVSTSVMEYSIFDAAVFEGWFIKNAQEALPHDAAAIRWGYFEDKSVVEEEMLFGSEEETAGYADVLRFDYGTGPVEASYRDISQSIDNLPNSIIERFISAKAPEDPRDRMKLESVELSVGRYASLISGPTSQLLKWFSKETRSIEVENEFDVIGDINEEERLEAHWKYLEDQLEKLGGVDQVLFSYLPVEFGAKVKEKLEGVDVAERIDAEKLHKKLKELLETEAYSSFIGLDGESYQWSDEEKEIILSRSKTLFDKLESEVLLHVLSNYEKAPRDLGLAATGNLSDEDSVARLETLIIDLAKKVILERSKDDRIKGKVDKAFVEVPDFKYDYEIRLAAAKALNDKTGSFESWSKEAKQELHQALKKAVEDSLNIGLFKDFSDKLLSRSLREWYIREQNLLKLLPPDPKSGN
ncbi:zinc-dependent metalloprotease [Pelagicoccus albus]|uniref:Zinc-dependent metalloprotease n=1 Tax=Pelagicoccus albus TaxID=415222 RepID=A0A7X1E990_9BACT|nr:zinc-dependent metalloprotease [Pelagicoccus albus]MBC2605542.1 zinc-dependent metalloprotease [Pelagicoccus albus]